MNREVFSYAPANGEGVRKAVRLRNGDFALVTTGGRFLRCTSAGKEILNFSVAVSTNGGRIEVTPEGHVIVPEMASNRVVEYDSSGKRVWECTAEEPIAACRLPDGNTLVTTLNQKRAIEFDRLGREVWEFKADTRVTRAFRR
jgi:outer membrane protein assembly factor BamB